MSSLCRLVTKEASNNLLPVLHLSNVFLSSIPPAISLFPCQKTFTAILRSSLHRYFGIFSLLFYFYLILTCASYWRLLELYLKGPTHVETCVHRFLGFMMHVATYVARDRWIKAGKTDFNFMKYLELDAYIVICFNLQLCQRHSFLLIRTVH